MVHLLEPNAVLSGHDARQEEQGFLKVDRQQQQVHELGNSRPGDMPQPRQLGVVPHRIRHAKMPRPTTSTSTERPRNSESAGITMVESRSH